jgi:DNA-binding transcriptional ArsR family regulator
VPTVASVTSDVDVLARFGRALADPIRCRLLLALRESRAYPSDLADALGVAYPAVESPGVPA